MKTGRTNRKDETSATERRVPSGNGPSGGAGILPSSTKDQRLMDAVVIVVVTIGVFAIAGAFDLYEQVGQWTVEIEAHEIDELLISLPVLAVLLVWYSYRRWRESAQAFTALSRAMKRLKTASVEISELERTEEALAEKSALLETTLENMSHGTSVYDADGKLVCFNQRYVDLCRYPPGFIRLGLSFEEAARLRAQRGDYGPGDVEELVRERVLASRRGEVGSGEHVWPDGVVIAVHRDPMPDGGYVTTYTDITERKKAEAEKEALEARLRHAQKMESLGTLAGGIAHEFNNMLVPILGLTELVKDDLPGESRTRENLDMVLEGGSRATELIKQIQDFSRMEEPEAGPVELQPLVRDAIELLRRTLPSTIEIRESIEAGAAMVRADPTRIHQIVMNLAANAADALGGKVGVMEFGVRTVAVNSEGAAPQPHAELTVRDTGCGMDRKTAERVFDPFFTTKEVGSGTGMGLAVVHGIVTSCGGVISVSSEPGRGTSFVTLFPLCQEGGEIDARPAEPDATALPLEAGG